MLFRIPLLTINRSNSLKKTFSHSFLLITGLPVVATLVYLIVLAQPAFETETKLIVRENQSGSGSAIPGFASAILGPGAKTSYEDALILEDYLHSAAFIEKAATRFDLRAHFEDAPSDPFRRLAPDAAAESLHVFFRKMVTIGIIPESSIVTVNVRAFSPAVAEDVATFIIAESEKMINDLNERLVKSQTTLAQRELSRSQARLMEVRSELLEFQMAKGMIDPQGETSAYFSNIAALDSRLVEKRTRLRIESQYLQEDAFDIRRLKQEIQALEEQRREETRVLVTDEDVSMANTLQAYETLKMQMEFAQTAYSSAFALMETTIMEASRQEKFLLVIAPPHTPEAPVFPRPVRGTLTVFVLSCIGFGIYRLILATVRDHTI